MELGFFKNISAIPLPVFYEDHSYKISVVRQLGIAFCLNILSLALPIMMLQIYDRIIPHTSFASLYALCGMVIIALILDIGLRMIRSYLVNWSAASSEHAAHCATIELFARVDVQEFEKRAAGEHLQNINAINKLREFYSGQAWASLIDVPFVIIFLALIAYLGGALVWVPLTLLAVFFVNAAWTSNALKLALEERNKSDETKASLVVSILKSIHTVKSLSFESFLLRKFERIQSHVSKDSYLVASASGQASILSAGFGQLCLIITVTAGLFLVLNGSLSVGGLSACTLLAGRCIQPVQRVLATWLRLQDLTLSRRQAVALFSMPSMDRSKKTHYMSQGRILMEKVIHTADSGDKLLDQVSLSIEPGSIVAITGGNSTAKSALLQIIAGIVNAESGKVFIDDIQPSQHSLSELKDLIGYLPQEASIFKGSILENITGFRNDADSVQNAIEAGADLGLDQVVDFLPHGYHTHLADSVSDPIPPGIKQRISLVRVLANKPAILLFDDADRALDKTGYNLLFRLIGRLKGKTTIILITQDQNLLSFADVFFHLEQGILTTTDPSGTHNLAILSHLQQGNI